MPVKVDALAEWLWKSDYNATEMKFLIKGFSSGFDLEYEESTDRNDTARNIPFTIGNKKVMWNKIMKVVSMKRYARPFKQIPFNNYVQSPIGFVPKAGNQTRLIFHLSYDFPSGHKSVNHYTPHEKCTVKYRDLDHAMMNSLHLLRMYKETNGQLGTLWFSKTDIKSAFRILCLKVGVFWLLVMYADHPETGNRYYFVNKCLPFDHSISCALFQ